MIKLKSLGPLEILVSISVIYVISMLIWTAATRESVLKKVNDVKSNHQNVVILLNNEIDRCSQKLQQTTSWNEDCSSVWSSSIIVDYILKNVELKNPYSLNKPLIQTSTDPRIQAEGKAGQSTDKGVIFVSSNDFNFEAGSEWVIGTCVKSPCVAAGNNELVSIYR
tara:strand:- start:116 stop:613 length:498 start_codon:yes stop_codon:yes gene_type:complete